MRSGVVVVGYDQSPASEPALDAAADEAVRRNVGLTVVHAFRRLAAASPPYEMPAADAPLSAALAIAEQGAERVRARYPVLAVEAKALAGAAPTVLAESSSDAELLVVGRRGRGGFAGLALGSVALRTVTRAACPTLVVRGGRHQTRGTVLAAVDIEDNSDEILDFAFAEAARRGARLKAVFALEMLWPFAYAGDTGELGRASLQAAERAGAKLERLLQPWAAKYPGVTAEHELAQGAPSSVLTEATTFADLVVIGRRRGRERGRGAHLGPLAHVLLLHSDCPVAVVPHG